eukprot:CAMPEP_0204574318 /NCGR_PEP_ID=MMETSP0661-20131031/40530_1 /ASSEMBLY_ACC=CAM_ASM_000606 /TAXON_ID=109239 /ORGANISM="Alexandrium margalefi, Strain AMGDE01CS-322" /LENGTH=527 /DNA_ID=CAMNT_0051582829 /DNA_START=73 /DNA_END=1656 /DNA_ORIENTATION=+
MAGQAGDAQQPLVGPPQSEMMTRHAPSGPSLRQAINDDPLMSAQEQTPAYRALSENGLICNQYRVRRVEDLDVMRGNADMTTSVLTQAATCNGCCCLMKFFVVSAGNVLKGYHSSGRYMFFGEGVHVYKSPYISTTGREVPLTSGAIVNGTKVILTVTQGFVGLAMDRGQPVLLPPGLHQWDSATLEFKELIDLSSSIIRLGPYTLITVDEGYAAVTQDNGEQKILEGGRTYMLTHRNWKFEKFMTKKMQTADVGPIQVTTGDNVPLEATATVNWLIEDARLAARMAANTMTSAGPPGAGTEFDITKIRADVVLQVTASLACFIGSVSYSGHGQRELAARRETDEKRQNDAADPARGGQHAESSGRGVLFDRVQLSRTTEHANEICQRYGVRIVSINLISASPADKGLLDALSQGAVAAVAAEQTETAARGAAQATLLKARAEAEAAKVRAAGDAEAEVVRAQGSIQAAKQLEESEVAVALAKLKQAGACLADGQANSFFFGLQSASDIPAGMLGNALMAESATRKK